MDYRKLIEMLEKELRQFTSKPEISSSHLEMIDMITHSIKSAETIMAMRDGAGYSGTYYDSASHYGVDGMSHAGRRMYRNSYGNSYENGYSSTSSPEEMMMKLEEMKRNAPENMKHQFQQMIDNLRR